MKEAIPHQKFWLSDLAVIAYVSLANFAWHLIAIRGYGYFRDELYYLVCSDHLAFGYVDHPPLSILLLKVIRFLFGDSLVAIRILPALGGALFVFMAGLMARELGGKKFAVLLASAAAFAPVGNFFLFHIYSMNFLDLLFWLAGLFIVLRIIKTDNPKYWLLFGLTAGLGLQNKVSVLFLGFGLTAGLLLTSKRRHLASPYLWLGGALAAVLFLPYILWNLSHGWPTLEWMRNVQVLKNIQNTPLGFLRDQILYNNPLTLAVWLPGLWYFFFHKEGKNFRLFGWMYLSLFLLFFLQRGKDYYLAGAYPILFAGGALQFEKWLRAKAGRWLRPALSAIVLASGFIFSPLVLPLLPVEKTIAIYRSLGMQYNQERTAPGVLPQPMADMFGWEEMAAKVAEAYESLTPEERSDCLIYVRNYGQAAAIDFFGKKYHLPMAACGHNNYWLWGPPEWSGKAAIIFGTTNDLQRSLADLSPYFQEVRHIATTACDYAMPYENNRPIFVCRGAKFSLRDIWTKEKHFI